MIGLLSVLVASLPSDFDAPPRSTPTDTAGALARRGIHAADDDDDGEGERSSKRRARRDWREGSIVFVIGWLGCWLFCSLVIGLLQV